HQQECHPKMHARHGGDGVTFTHDPVACLVEATSDLLGDIAHNSLHYGCARAIDRFRSHPGWVRRDDEVDDQPKKDRHRHGGEVMLDLALVSPPNPQGQTVRHQEVTPMDGGEVIIPPLDIAWSVKFCLQANSWNLAIEQPALKVEYFEVERLGKKCLI